METATDTLSTSWHSYPKVHNLGHPNISELLLDDVICEEKIDGSQFSFGKFDGELRAKSKGKLIVIDSPEKMFNRAIDTIKELEPLLRDGWTYRAEYLSKPHHNTLTYDRVPEKHLVIFDINTNEESYLPYHIKNIETHRLGLEVVPLLYRGKIDDTDIIMGLLETDSFLGGTKVEGIVIKNYERFDRGGKTLIGKYVSEKFREKHNKEWKKANPQSKDIVSGIILSLRTDARWEKAIQHLRDNGDLTDSPKDIGGLIKEVQGDTLGECEEYIKDVLYKYAKPKIIRGIIAGLPEWYKEKLMNKQFEHEKEISNG